MPPRKGQAAGRREEVAAGPVDNKAAEKGE